ncbi:histidine--tRNA ligase [Candidatus Wolfebacteria bacterium]|nr:histidine--tRNA ligase [Candidatus Wolfebacteria bacterium]
MPKSVIKTTKKKAGSGQEKILFRAPRGMHDILPEDQPWWNKARKTIDEVADFYNFSRIDTPILEEAAIFEKGLGTTTDIVSKQMYVLRTKGGDRLVLRPEGTTGVIRAYFEHGLSRLSQPLRLYYVGSFFRYERPQAGRYRELHQVGFEMIGGEDDPIYDAQMILVSFRLAEELKIKNLIVQLNSIGCRNCRPVYRRRLQEYYRKMSSGVCKDCRARLNLNPLRLLDCKEENCEKVKSGAPTIINHLCQSCRSHFKAVLEYLDELGLPYTLNAYLVRGLDYYNRTVFEISSENNASFAFGGGGRYDYLGEIIGKRKTPLPAVGSALGMERLIEEMRSRGVNGTLRSRGRVFLVQIGSPAKIKALGLIEKFREANIKALESLGRASFKSQLRIADKEGVDLSLILGQREVFEDSIIIRDMKSGNQETVPIGKMVEEVKRRLK